MKECFLKFGSFFFSLPSALNPAAPNVVKLLKVMLQNLLFNTVDDSETLARAAQSATKVGFISAFVSLSTF